MPNFLAVVECAIEHEGKYLMIRRPEGIHAGGLLAFPGGKVDYEDGSGHQNILINAVKREVFEEIGLDLVDPIQFATSSYFIDTYQQHVLDIIFCCRLKKTKIEIIPSEKEVPEYFWLSSQEILAHDKAPEWIERYISIINNLLSL